MRWTRWAQVGLVGLLTLVSTSAASAAVLVPPGHAGAQQYFETIPTSSGSAAPPGSVSGSGINTRGSQALAHLGHGRAGASRLAKLGTNGQAAAALANSTAPTPAGVPGAAGGADARAHLGAPPSGSVGSGLSHALTGSDTGGLGVALPLFLATALVAAAAVAAARLRRRGRPLGPGV